MPVQLRELTHVLRTKNADPFITTCDIFFTDDSNYQLAIESGRFTTEAIADLLNIPQEAVVGIFRIEPLSAIKVSYYKYANGQYYASGDLEDTDTSGMQQHLAFASMVIVPGQGDEHARPTTITNES